MDFFSILPSEIIIEILSRFNVVDILRCKGVCKSWLQIVRTDHLVSSHLSRSVPGFFVRFVRESEAASCEILEFEEGNENQEAITDPIAGYNKMQKFHFNSVMRFNIPLCEDTKLDVHSSANGLLFLVKTEWDWRYKYETSYICNPITREYINICSRFAHHREELVGYGFGVSKLGKHTLLRISQRNHVRKKYIHCDVYSLGSGSWRSVAPPDPSWCGDSNTPLEFIKYMEDGLCLDGRFHWLNLFWNLLCFDLETELFSIYDLPLPFEVGEYYAAALSALGNSLCLCDTMSGNEIIIWLAEERGGVEKSWIKEFVIPKTPGLWCYPLPNFSEFLFRSPLSVVKAFKNGDILLECLTSLFLYHPYENAIYELDSWKRRMRYTPSSLTRQFQHGECNILLICSFSLECHISFSRGAIYVMQDFVLSWRN